MTKLYINDVEYPLNDGIIINDKKTEELDSAIVTIPLVEKLELSAFDSVRLTGDMIGEKYYVINTWTNTTASFTPLRHTYNISLVSEAIKLQKIVCPNLAITQPIGISKKTIRKKLEEYYELYIQPQYPELILSQELIELTNDKVAPEYLFAKPTMFEVINSLLISLNCCVNVVNNQITYKRLDNYNKAIDTTKLYYENDTQSINEYANRLDIDVENAISEKTNYSSPAGVSVRAESSVLLTDDNMEIVLDKPIYDLENQSVWVYFPVVDLDDAGKIDAPTKTRKYDITNYVVEKSVYDTYLTSTKAGVITEKNYKRNALYYFAGGNKIQGLTYSEKTWLQIDAWSALYNILYQLATSESGYTIGFTEGELKNKVVFKVEYKTSDSFRLNVEKQNKYNATLIDNQSEKQIDADTFGHVEQDKINRLGNKELIITATYKKNDAIPQLGDYIDEYVLAQRELVYYDDYVLFKGYLYKNFIRKNMFYGLSSKKRFTQISDEFVVRNEVINYDLSFSSTTSGTEYKYLKRFILNPLSNANYDGKIYEEKPKYMLFKFKDNNNNEIVRDGYIVSTPSMYACGKSNVLNIKMQDNYSAGLQIAEKVTGGKLQKYVKYVDNYGEFKNFSLILRSNKKEDFIESFYENKESFERSKTISDELPYISEYNSGSLNTQYLLEDSKTVYKDNRETFALSLNFNFKDNKEVIIGDIASFTGVVTNQAKNLKFCYSKTTRYEEGDKYGIGEEVQMQISSYNATQWYENGTLFSNIVISPDLAVSTSGWKSYGILNEDGELILGINSLNDKDAPSTNLYLHIERKPY